MNAIVKSLRSELGKNLDFSFWVRRFSDGVIYVGLTNGNDKQFQRLIKAVQDLYWDATPVGRAGTSGEHVAEISPAWR